MSELRFDSVTVRYGAGSKALVAADSVSLTVPTGKVVGLVGESGSGKSSLARAAVGLAPVSSGRLLIDGLPVPRRRRNASPPIQMVFQDPYASLDPRMTIDASIREAMPRALRHNREAARAEVDHLLSLVNLDLECASSLPSRLSGGQRQRVALARALAGQPQVVIADEITSALDVSVQGTVLNLVRDLQRELKLSMLFISHNLAVVRYVSDFLAVIYLGRIVESGSTERVIADPQHPYTRQLLGAVPRRGGSGLALTESDPALQAVADAEPADPHAPPSGCRYHPRCPIGPRIMSERTICADVDPQEGAQLRIHAAACHFAPAQTIKLPRR